MKKILQLSTGAAVAIMALAAQAQTTPSNGTPANVGVSQGTAVKADAKAVPRNDTATLVRTSPDAADKAKAAADSTSTGAGMTRAGQTSQQITAPSDVAPVRRARKADRN